MSLSFILLTVFFELFRLSNAIIEWTPLSDETGNSPLGLESPSKFGTQYGGKGGAPWQEDCDGKGGIKAIQFKCGQYVGSIKILCGNGQWLTTRGLGKDRGKGNLQTFFTAKSQITKIVINAAKYVDRITLYNGSKVVLQCGKSTGGKPYSATPPHNAAQLCGFRGRSGWWIDALSVGWCGQQAVQKPNAPGCWVLTPSGCPKQKFNAKKWTRDSWGEKNRNAKWNRNACLVTRKREYDTWCGAKDTKMTWNASPGRRPGSSWTWKKPRAPGCWVLTPNGCPKQKFNAKKWTRDSWGEKNRNAKWNRNACLVTRKREYDTWCGAKDTKMTWNRSQNGGTCKVVLYQHCGFHGYKHTYSKSTPFVRKGANDQYSAVRLIGCEANQVTLFQHYNWKGKAWRLKGNDSCFVNNGFNDIVSSLSINKRSMSPGKPSVGTQVKPTQARKCAVKFDNKWPHCTNIKCFSNVPLTDVQNQCAANKMCNGFSYTVGAPKKGNGCLKQKCSNVAVNGFGQKSHMYYECTTWTKPTYHGSSQMIDDEQFYHQEDSDFDEELVPLDTSEFAQVQDDNNSNSSLLVYSGVFCGFIGGIGLYFAFKKTIDPEGEQTSSDYTILL